MNLFGTIVFIAIAFVIGYVLVAWLIDRFRGATSTTADSTAGPRTADTGSRSSAPGVPGYSPPSYEDPETRYARVLGLPQPFTTNEIRQRYRTLVASYHPDQVARLGPELQQMAAQKTREILEAYEYFRVKYRL